MSRAAQDTVILTDIAKALGVPPAVLLDVRHWLDHGRRGNEDITSFPRNHVGYTVGLSSVLTQFGQFDEAISVTSDAIHGVQEVQGSGRISTDLHSTVIPGPPKGSTWRSAGLLKLQKVPLGGQSGAAVKRAGMKES